MPWTPSLRIALAGMAFLAGASTPMRDPVAAAGLASTSAMHDGQLVYTRICQACHMADARGGATAGIAIPALAGNPRLADPRYMIDIMMAGRAGMPWFSDMLTPAQMAAVATYVRSHFNDYRDPVTEDQVKRAFVAPPDREHCDCSM